MVVLHAGGGRQVPVELVQVEHGEHDAEQVDQDPDGVQHVVAVRSLRIDNIVEVFYFFWSRSQNFASSPPPSFDEQSFAVK